MKILFKQSVCVVALLSLISCKPSSYNHDYLLEHPNVLKKAIEQCQLQSESTDYCNTVKVADNEFSALVAARANDPELFGKQILMAQMELAKTQMALQKGENSAKLKETYREQEKKVKILLAVVSATTSEEL